MGDLQKVLKYWHWGKFTTEISSAGLWRTLWHWISCSNAYKTIQSI